MAGKTSKNKTTKRSVKTKKTINKKEENSFGIMMLIITGVALLIYFASNISVEDTVSTQNQSNSKKEISEESFTISGKTYISKDDAYNTLKEIPQTMRTSEEILFVESWISSLEEYK